MGEIFTLQTLAVSHFASGRFWKMVAAEVPHLLLKIQLSFTKCQIYLRAWRDARHSDYEPRLL